MGGVRVDNQILGDQIRLKTFYWEIRETENLKLIILLLMIQIHGSPYNIMTKMGLKFECLVIKILFLSSSLSSCDEEDESYLSQWDVDVSYFMTSDKYLKNRLQRLHRKAMNFWSHAKYKSMNKMSHFCHSCNSDTCGVTSTGCVIMVCLIQLLQWLLPKLIQ